MARYEAEVEERALIAAGIKKESESSSRSRRFRRSLEEGPKIKGANLQKLPNGSDSEDDAIVAVVTGHLEIEEDLVIGKYQALTVSPGTIIKFHKDVTVTVRGGLMVNGERDRPVLLEPAVAGERWKGIVFNNSSPVRGTESYLRFVKITGSEVAIDVKAGVAPELDHVVVESNVHGIQIENADVS